MDLSHFFKDTPKAALAFSGGVDSAYLLYAAMHLGADVRAYYVKSAFQPQFELEDARRLAALLTDLKVHEVHLLPFHQFGERKYQQMGVPYDYSGIEQLHPEDLADYRQIFLDAGLDCTFR